jgi:hypothetical protein
MSAAKHLIELGTLAALAVVVYGLYNMTITQGQTNDVVDQVIQDMKVTRQLTIETNNELTPLSEATAKLAHLNELVNQVLPQLHAATQSLNDLADKETKIVSVVTALNSDTGAVVNDLKTVTDLNNTLLSLNTTSADGAYAELGKINNLNQLSDVSIAQLRELNKKFALLGSLPTLP